MVVRSFDGAWMERICYGSAWISWAQQSTTFNMSSGNLHRVYPAALQKWRLIQIICLRFFSLRCPARFAGWQASAGRKEIECNNYVSLLCWNSLLSIVRQHYWHERPSYFIKYRLCNIRSERIYISSTLQEMAYIIIIIVLCHSFTCTRLRFISSGKKLNVVCFNLFHFYYIFLIRNFLGKSASSSFVCVQHRMQYRRKVVVGAKYAYNLRAIYSCCHCADHSEGEARCGNRALLCISQII